MILILKLNVLKTTWQTKVLQIYLNIMLWKIFNPSQVMIAFTCDYYLFVSNRVSRIGDNQKITVAEWLDLRIFHQWKLNFSFIHSFSDPQITLVTCESKTMFSHDSVILYFVFNNGDKVHIIEVVVVSLHQKKPDL